MIELYFDRSGRVVSALLKLTPGPFGILYGRRMLRLSALDSYPLFHAQPHICHSDVHSKQALWCRQSHSSFPQLCCLMPCCLSSSVFSVGLFADWAEMAQKKTAKGGKGWRRDCHQTFPAMLKYAGTKNLTDKSSRALFERSRWRRKAFTQVH